MPMTDPLPELPRPEEWMDDALCATTDPEAFFPEKGGSTRDAKRICLACDVKDQCLQYALENDERFGIYGGFSERERRRLRRGQPVRLPSTVARVHASGPRRWWVPADTATLIRLHGEGKSDRAIAALMERHPEMIAQRRRKLGLALVEGTRGKPRAG